MKVPTLKQVPPAEMKIFDELNALHFKGKLKRIPIRRYGNPKWVSGCTGMFYTEWHGYAGARRDDSFPMHIAICRAWSVERALFRSTLLHEMLHYSRWVNYGPHTGYKGSMKWNAHDSLFKAVEARLRVNDPILRPAPAPAPAPAEVMEVHV